MDEADDDGDDEHEMDEAACHVESEESQGPQDDEDESER
jgi:hypothetical protein